MVDHHHRNTHIWLNILDDLDSELSDSVFGCLSGLCKPEMAHALMVAATGIVGHAATLVEQAAYAALDEMIDGGVVTGVGWEHLEKAFGNWAPAHGRANPFSLAARVPDDGTPVASEEDGAKAAVNGDVMSGARGRTRKNTRDATHRK